jgi:hypothetical protein
LNFSYLPARRTELINVGENGYRPFSEFKRRNFPIKLVITLGVEEQSNVRRQLLSRFMNCF